MNATQETGPEFSLPGTEGEGTQKYSLNEYTEEGGVVLIFYPFDFSPVCTDVICHFRDAEFLSFTDNVDVFGVSLDSCYAHMRFIEEYDIPFPLLSDPTGPLTERSGLASTKWDTTEAVPKQPLLTIMRPPTIATSG